jgi:hypothetical protein
MLAGGHWSAAATPDGLAFRLTVVLALSVHCVRRLTCTRGGCCQPSICNSYFGLARLAEKSA